MLAAGIPTAYLAPLLAVSFTGVITLMAWTVRELSRISAQLSVTEERSSDHERRIRDLEIGRGRGST